jgi:hypothetical protein
MMGSELLTAEQVQAEERRFIALIRRTHLTGSSTRRPPAMPISVLYAPFFGSNINGLALSNQWYRQDWADISESHLAFVLSRLRSTHIDIEIPPCLKYGVLREDLNSVYVPSTDPRAFRLFIDTGDPTAASGHSLEINNFDSQSYESRASGSAMANGFWNDGIYGSINYGPEDCYIMAELLPRLLRVRSWIMEEQKSWYLDTVTALFRDREPYQYVLIAVPIDFRRRSDLDAVRVAIKVGVDTNTGELGEVQLNLVQDDPKDRSERLQVQAEVFLVPLFNPGPGAGGQ